MLPCKKRRPLQPINNIPDAKYPRYSYSKKLQIRSDSKKITLPSFITRPIIYSNCFFVMLTFSTSFQVWSNLPGSGLKIENSKGKDYKCNVLRQVAQVYFVLRQESKKFQL